MPSSFDAREFLAGFLAEAHEHLTSANQNLLALETSLQKGQPHPRAVRELFRSLHTLKGLSSMVGAEPISDIAHAMETVLRASDRNGGRMALSMVDVLLRGTRAIEERVRALEQGRPLAEAPLALLDAFKATSEQPAPLLPSTDTPFTLDAAILAKLGPAEREQMQQGLASGRRIWRADFVPSPERAAAGISITTVRERMGKLGEIVKVIPVQRPGAGIAFTMIVVSSGEPEAVADAACTTVDALAEVHGTAPTPPFPIDEELLTPAGTERQSSIRVEVARLDDAFDILSSLVVTRYRLDRAVADLAARGADVRGVQAVVQEHARQLKHLRAALTRARMVSVADMLQRVPLLVRGLARQTGKKVRLDVQAGHAELDKGVADRVFPAIVHLVRNAVDHALESPAERSLAGKPEEGLIVVSASERGSSQLELRITDDGRGIDREKVAQRAGRPIPTTDEGLLELICTPGLSTQDTVTHTSGRGMGMDIVRGITTSDLGGELALATAAGRGTTFTLRIPLTITIVDAFLFESGRERFAIPVSTVEEIIDLSGSTVTRAPWADGDGVRLLDRRGTPVPLIRLQSLFKLPMTEQGRKALVVRRNGEPFAYEVDRLLGQQEVVVRPLEDPLVRRPGFSGATDVGDGKPTLVIDLVALSATVQGAQA